MPDRKTIDIGLVTGDSILGPYLAMIGIVRSQLLSFATSIVDRYPVALVQL